MNRLWCSLRGRLLRLPARETDYAVRGFRGAAPEMKGHLERIGAAFLEGYHAALPCPEETELVTALNSTPFEYRGFAFEGAAMAMALLDFFTPWRAVRIRTFLAGAGDAHAYMIHVGVGWMWARLPISPSRARQQLDPVLGWLGCDGYGFHEGFFHWPKYISGQRPPKKLTGYETRVFDQGLGRSWWFVNGGNANLIAQSIEAFAADRQPDLWSGIGLAATYAGGVGEDVLRTLRECAGVHWPHLAQGAAFAAKARQRAGNSTASTEFATRIFCGMPAADAARLCDATLENLPAEMETPAYEIWRQRIQTHFAQTRQFQKA